MLVQYGGGIQDARGSIGGQTHSRNRFGNYVRARTTPVNPKSSRQNLIRAAISSLAQQWSNILDQAQRDLWEVYADSITRTNKLGQQIKLTGFNHFIRSNSIRLQSADSVILPGPTVLTLPGADPVFEVEVDETNQEISVTFDETLAWNQEDNGFMYVFMSQPKQVGINFIGGPFRLAGALDGATGTPLTSPQVLAVPFPVAENQVIVCRARISELDGRLSDTFQFQSSVIA